MTDSAAPRALDDYYLLGRSGLRVSPLCLGTMTFGTEWGWGSDEEVARALFDRYLELGGNFVDTAEGYTDGRSEAWVGKFIADAGVRDRVVLSTKFSFNRELGNPNAGGNGRKNLLRALEGSLIRLRTDYVDLYWVHAWDTVTPIEEVMSTLDACVRAGKIRAIGLSDVPAWLVARAQTLADWRGWEPLSALQLEYSLVERTIEREHVPAALELGLAISPWAPLASGFLTGKYRREESPETRGRLDTVAGTTNPNFHKFTNRNWAILEVLLDVAKELGRTPAQVAIQWATKRPGVVSTNIGATRLTQLEENLSALDFEIPDELAARLDAASRPETTHPYHFFEPTMQGMITGGTNTRRRPAWYRPTGH